MIVRGLSITKQQRASCRTRTQAGVFESKADVWFSSSRLDQECIEGIALDRVNNFPRGLAVRQQRGRAIEAVHRAATHGHQERLDALGEPRTLQGA